MTAALAVSETIYDVPLADISLEKSLPNYRQRKGDAAKFEELVSSVRKRGVLQPLVLRRASIGLLELVFGHRRLAAATEAGLASVPCVIREYDDETVRDARMIENAARENPHPLDQAEEYAAALKRGHSPQAIAEKLGQSVRYVLQRLALHELCSAGQLALEQGYISLDVAVLIARLPGEKIQAEALRRVSADQAHAGEGLMLLETAREEIESSVMLDLSEAQFRLDDAELVPEAGPCTTCKKRTGNQTELFADATKGDLCIDPTCHRSKLDALYQLRVKNAKADGVAVVPAKKAREVLDNAYGFGSGEFVRLDGRAMVGMKEKQVRDLLGKHMPPVTITQDPKTGQTVELVSRSALKVAQSKADVKAPASPAKADAKAAKEREVERMQAEVRRRVMLELVESMEGDLPQNDVPGLQVMRVLVLAAVHSLPPDVAKAVANRRGCPMAVEPGAATSKKGRAKRQETLTPEQRLKALVETLDATHLGGLLLELLLHRAAPGKWSEAHESYVEATVVFGVDVAAIGATVKAEQKAKADGKSKPKKPAASVHLLALGKHGACDKAEPGDKLTTRFKEITCKACLAVGESKPEPAPASKPKPPKRRRSSEPKAPRPEHPAKGQTVHYIDTSGLSPTGVACGGKVGTSSGKGTVTEEASKVTCPGCRRLGGLDAAAPEPEGDAGEPEDD